MPIITFDRMEPAKRGNFEGRKVFGVKEDGQEWDTFLFETVKDNGNQVQNPMIRTILAAQAGDKINITMIQKGKFWNATGVEIMEKGNGTAPVATKPKAQATSGGYKKGGSTYGKNNRGEDTFRTAVSQTRSSAAYLAHNIVDTMVKGNMFGKSIKPDLVIDHIQKYTEMFYGYFENGRFDVDGEVVAEKPANLKAAAPADDVPPPADDDDIPF